MDAAGLAPDGTKAAVPDDPDFRTQVFRAEQGEDGDLLPAKSGNYYVVLVNGTIPPKLKPLDAVRTQALAAWTEEQRAILLRKKAEELAISANKGQSLDDIAKAIGVTVQSSPALNRQSADTTFSPELVSKIFTVSFGGVVFGPQSSGGDFVIARVAGIVHPIPPTNNSMFRQGVREISSNVGGDITESLAAAARTKQGVKINQKMLSDVIGEGS
jgi:peptidyl-prolyl cis-trans isomerase D